MNVKEQTALVLPLLDNYPQFLKACSNACIEKSKNYKVRQQVAYWLHQAQFFHHLTPNKGENSSETTT